MGRDRQFAATSKRVKGRLADQEDGRLETSRDGEAADPTVERIYTPLLKKLWNSDQSANGEQIVRGVNDWLASRSSLSPISNDNLRAVHPLEPNEPIYWRKSSISDKPGAGESGQLRRRAQILANTRRLVAEEGIGNFTLRQVADASGVSVPTVYNNIGSRDEVIFAAAEEYFHAKLMCARAETVLGSAHSFNAALIAPALRNSVYQRTVINHLYIYGASRARVARDWCSLLVRELLSLHSQNGDFYPGADLGLLAKQLREQWRNTFFGWATGEISDAQLWPLQTYRSGLLMQTFMRGRPADFNLNVVMCAQQLYRDAGGRS